jgi:hypothetical protein
MVEFEGTEILTSRVMYESTPITVTADQALAALDGNGEAKSAKAEASEFLQDVRARQWTDVRQGRQAGGRRSGHLGEVIGAPPERRLASNQPRQALRAAGSGRSQDAQLTPKMTVFCDG